MSPSTDSPPPPRRWLRVSLRGLMILVLLIGGGLGWLVHRAKVQRDAVAAIRRSGGTVSYHLLDNYGGDIPLRDRPRHLPGWFDGLGIDDRDDVRAVILGSRTTDADLEQVERLPKLVQLVIGGSGVTEDRLDGLRKTHPNLVISP